MKSKMHSTTAAAATATTSEVKLETQGIACWDFAYPTGECCLTSGKNCFRSKSRKQKKDMRTRERERERVVVVDRIMPASPILPAENADQIEVAPTTQKRIKESTPSESRTYLLSSPTASSIAYPQTHTTIATLLMTPHTQLIFLVPQSHILCPKVCEFSRLARAGGSAIQVLPVPPPFSMSCTCAQGSDKEIPSDLEKKAVDEVVRKVIKYTRARSFDGYLAFEDDRTTWTFLEQVGKGVKRASKK